jgi:hypothetical protein
MWYVLYISFNYCSHDPDVLHKVPNSELVQFGLNEGNAMRIKELAVKWWAGPDAKRKHTPDDDAREFFSGVPPAPKKPRAEKRYSFETRYKDGSGAKRYPGTAMVPGRAPPNEEYFYFFDAAGGMVPMPLGWIPVAEGEEEPDDGF